MTTSMRRPSAYRNFWPGDPNVYGSDPYAAIVPPSQHPSAAQWFDANDAGSSYSVFGVIEFNPVPEPATLWLLGSGLALARAAARAR